MQYRMKKSGEVIEEQVFREMFPQVSLPAVLTREVVNEYGADEVIQTLPPAITSYQTISSVVKLNKSKEWEIVWVVVDITNEEAIASIKLTEETNLLSSYNDAVRSMLDTEARKKDYDDIRSASLRGCYPGPFQKDGLAFALWMDNCWIYKNKIVKNIKNGSQKVLSVAELISAMPKLVLPVNK